MKAINSLRLIILAVVAFALIVAVLVGGLAAQRGAARFAQNLQDQNLRAMAFGFFASVTASQGTWVTPEELADFIPADVDQYFYKFLGPKGAYISGYNFVQVPLPQDTQPGQTYFATWTTGSGEAFRGVSLSAFVDGNQDPGWVTLQVAQSTRGAQALVTRQMRSYYQGAGLISAGVLISAVLIVLMIFQPLQRLAQAVQRRGPDDLSPIRQPVPHEVQPLKDRINLLFHQVNGEQQAQRRLIANVAHQLRTPLTTIRLRSQLAKEARDPLIHVEAMDKAAQDAGDLAQRLVALEVARNAVRLETVDVKTLLAMIEKDWIDKLRQARITLEIQKPASDAHVVSNYQVLTEIAGNVIENAVRHSGCRKICIDFSDDRLTIRDDGMGIAPQELETVFERFFTGSSAKQPGSGLGLSIVKEMTNTIGVGVKIRSDNGTSVEFSFG